MKISTVLKNLKKNTTLYECNFLSKGNFIMTDVYDQYTMVLTHNSLYYSVSVSRSKDVPAFGPHIPENIKFPKSEEFAEFLLAKGNI